jgi:hypothetical protein
VVMFLFNVPCFVPAGTISDGRYRTAHPGRAPIIGTIGAPR